MTGFNPEQPFDTLPKLPPAAELETRDILKAAIAAHRELAELKGVGAVIPNQSILINGIVLQEAKASSEIENIVTTNDELYRTIGREDIGGDSPAKEVLRYREALWYGYEKIKQRPITTNLLVKIVGIIRRTDAGIRKTPGTRLTNSAGRTVYMPPAGEPLLRNLLTNLETYLHAENRVDLLVKLAVMHYQFEAIHPFTDGNGRTGRILNLLYLVEKGLLDVPVLYLSQFIIQNKSAYYEGLRRVTEEGAWQDWILYMLRGIQETARRTNERIVRIRTLMDEWEERVASETGNPHTKALVELAFAHPYVKAGSVVEAGIAKRQTAAKYLKRVELTGLLHGVKRGRETYYVNEPLLEALTD